MEVELNVFLKHFYMFMYFWFNKACCFSKGIPFMTVNIPYYLQYIFSDL